MATDSGFSNQKKKGIAQFETVHNLGSSSYGKVAANKALFEILPSAAIVSVTDILGSDGQVQYWNIELTGHTAAVGNTLRFDAGSLLNFYFEIMQVIDADNFYILPISDIKPTAAMTATVMGWVTQKMSADGEISVSITSTPTSYEYDGLPQTVIQDTVVPANNRALPNLNFIYKDGVQVPITKDTGLPSNTVGMPVEIVAASGTPINITAGDINVQLSDQGVNFDSLRVGDGSGNYLGINASTEALVHDTDVLAKLTDISGQLPATLGQKAMAASLAVTLASDQPVINTQAPGVVSTLNSYSGALGIGGVFTGTSEDVLNYGSISIAVHSDRSSASLGLVFQCSEDGITWFPSDAYNFLVSSGIQTYSLAPVARYFRIQYTNGAIAATDVDIQVTYRQFYVKPSSHRIGDTINAENDAELTKSVLTAQTPGGSFVPIDATTAGNLKISVEEFDTAALNWGAGNASTRTQRVILATDQVLPLPTGAATETTLSAISGKLPATLGQKASAASLAVVLSSEQQTILASLVTKLDSLITSNAPKNFDSVTNVPTTTASVVAPAGTRGFIIQNSANANSGLRFTPVGGGASATVGFFLGVGQSTSYIESGGDLAIFDVEGTGIDAAITWFI